MTRNSYVMKPNAAIRGLLRVILPGLLGIAVFPAFSQSKTDIWALMNRRDLRLTEIDALAKKHFDEVGRVRGTGYKQYERWKYEKQFHLDDKGYILPDDFDAIQYQAAASALNQVNAAAGAWTEVGPQQWKRTTSWNPGVGRITAIAVFPANTNIIYVTTPGGGIWKSTAGGNQWTALSDGNNSLMNMFSIAVDPTNENNVFSGSSGGTIYRSTDGGASWGAKVATGGTVRKILFHPATNQTLFAASNGGIYKSIDGGNTWTRKSTVSMEDIEFHPGNPDTMYAAGTSVYRSVNAGETWTQLTATNGITNTGRTLLGVSAADPRVVYAVQANGSEFGRLYRSNDAGSTFITTITGAAASCTNFFGYSSNGCGTGGQAGYDMAITVNPVNANEVHIAGIICWKSTNGGSTFTATTEWSLPNATGYNHADVHVLEWVGSTIYSGSDGGIYKSTDYAGNWTDLSNGLGIRQFYRIATANTSRTIVTGGAQDNGSSIYKNTGWIDWLGADGMDCLVSPLDSNLIWGTSQYGSLYRTTDGGNSYSNVTRPRSGNWVTPLAIESNSNVIYGGWKGVWKSTDRGATWTVISQDTSSALNVLAVAPSNPAYIYASTGADLFVTKNGGSTWTKYLMATGISITSIAIHPSNPEKIWISSNNSTNRAFVSNDAGATFTNISGNLPAMAARSIVVDNTPDEGLYIGMNIGVYYMNKNMTSWVDLTANLPQVAINEVEIQKKTGVLRVATYGRGIWERSAYATCAAPSGLSTTNLNSTAATLNWTASAGASGYTVDYKASTSTTWTNVLTNSNTTSYVLSGLIPGTSYDWRVSGNCASGSSDFISSVFTTNSACGKSASLTTGSITTQAATLSWTGIDTALSYNIDYKTGASNIWTPLASGLTQTTFSWTGLTEGTLYKWRVNATCTLGAGNYDSTQFTTAITCNAPATLSTTSITATAATLNWSSVSGAANYAIDTRVAGGTWASKATNLTGTTYNLTGLTGGTSYDWRIRTNCGTLSGFSTYNSTSFNTPVAACTDSYESNNTFGTAKTISLNTAINGLIPSASDSDYFKISSPNSTATNIRVSLYNLPANYNIYLYDRNQVLIGSGIQTGTTPDTIVFNSTAKRATYYIKVSPVAGAFHTTTCYNLRAESSATTYRAPVPKTSSQPSLAYGTAPLPENRLSIYPVPARQQLYIDFTSEETHPAQLQFYDITGRLLKSMVVDIKSGNNHFSLETGNYHNGVYLIKMVLPHQIVTQKVLIQK